MGICCSFTTNKSPTIDEIKAIETGWNSFVDTYFSTVDAKYSDTNLSTINLEMGVTWLRNTDGSAQKHESTGEPLIRMITYDESAISITREELSALRLKSLKVDIKDDFICSDMGIVTNSNRVVMGLTSASLNLLDQVRDVFNDDNVKTGTITDKGINTLLSENKVHIKTHIGHWVYGDHIKKDIVVIA